MSPSMIAMAILSFAVSSAAFAAPLTFPQGAATPPEVCGACHKAIYNEYAYGFGSDIRNGMTMSGASGEKLKLPANVADSATAHAFANVDPFPIHAREAEEGGRSCNVCHFPEAFAVPDINATEMAKPKPRLMPQGINGLTCASCHLTPAGKIRTAHDVKAPHETIVEPLIQTAAMCAYCHSMGKRVAGKQTQTFYEWREDFFNAGLGKQHCQDCHMPRTARKVTENSDTPVRAVASHLWTGGHSLQRLASALSLVAMQPESGQPRMDFHIINIGAGHSVPTGSNRRAVYLIAEIADRDGNRISSREWLFAPWYGNRPDDKGFLDEDKLLPDAVAAAQADAQGPHETAIRAGEERIISWTPELKAGEYVVTVRLVYDLNRYNDRSFTFDQTEIGKTRLTVSVKGKV